jgi:integrase
MNLKTPTASLLDFANAYLNMSEKRFVRKTFAEKKLAFRYLFKKVPPTVAMADITPLIALEGLNHINNLTTGNVANMVRKNLIAAWGWGRKFYNLPSLNPFAEVDKFPADRGLRYVPSEEDFWKVYKIAEKADKTMLLLMLHTGARRMEVFRLTWDDVDFIGNKIRFGTRKTGHGGMEYAWIPMTTELHQALSEHQKLSKSKFVFTDLATGEQYTSRQHFMENLCNRAGVKPFGFHAVRHLSATILAYAGLDIPTVQAVLRHKSPNTTARYIKSLGIQPDKLDRVFANRQMN